MVGRSRFCDFPENAKRLPVVGGFADPNLEAILALRPTHVIGTRGPAGPSLKESLASHGVNAMFPPTDSVAQIRAMLVEVGKALGLAQQANELLAELDKELAALDVEVKRRDRVRVVMLFDFDPIIAAGPGGFPDELLTLAGGDNLVDAGGDYPQLNVERLFALDPDIIIDASGHGSASKLDQVRKRPGFKGATGEQKGWPSSANLRCRIAAGARIVEGVAELASLIHDADLRQALP